MRKLPPVGLPYFSNTSTVCVPSLCWPELISKRFSWCPRVVVISRFVCAAAGETGFTVTSSGSRSECSAWKCSGSPMTTELTGSGIRIEVATRGISRSVMTFSSRLARVRITGSSLAPLPTGATPPVVQASSDSASFVRKHLPASSTYRSRPLDGACYFPPVRLNSARYCCAIR